MQRRLKMFLALLVMLFFFSCSSSHSENDSDILPDADYNSSDAENIDDDSDSQNSEIIDDSDETPDLDTEDSDHDIFDEEWQRDIDIPEMSDDPYFEAYGDADFNVAYYYYGDEPTPANDPENVKVLWSKRCKNDSCTECTPKPYDLCAENYPFEPQIIGGSGSGKKKSIAGKFQCDALLTPGAWATSDLFDSMVFDELDGKVLFLMHSYGTSWRGDGTYLYDLNTRKIERLGRVRMDGWQNKRYYFISTYDYRVDTDNKSSPYYGNMNRHLLYYDKETNSYGKAFKSTESLTNIKDFRASENYAFMSAKFSTDGSDMRILYTKIGEWDKWKELTYKKETLYGDDRRAGYPSMIGSLVTYFDYDVQVQVCDLAVGDSSCFQVSRADEYGRYPIFKDKNTLVYAAEDIKTSKDSIVLADISDPKNIKYITMYEAGDMLGIGGDDLDEKYLLIKRRYISQIDSSKELNDHCVYRFSDKKLICFDEEFDLEIEKNESFIYKNFYIFRSVQNLVVRDLECYCDFYPNKCPLIEYKPNPENPKKPWGFDWKPENLRNINTNKNGEKR